ncbi:MAG: SDR family NAD(P)-dependent oxidoreductase [Shimia sp.]
MDLNISGKRALVTGGAGGLGRAIARDLLSDGCHVVLTDFDEDDLREAREALAELGEVATIAADLTDPDGAKKVVAACKDAGGMPDILVSAAGITGAKGDPLELDDDDYAETWQINFMGAVRIARATLPAMAEKGWGRVVFICSENAVQPYWDEAVYNTAKAGLMNFAKGLSRNYAAHGVLVNTVSPAFIETPMTDGMMDKRAKEMGTDRETAIQSFLEEERPYLELKRRGTPEEVAAAVAFMVSDRASFVNGANLRVDGGAVATMAI